MHKPSPFPQYHVSSDPGVSVRRPAWLRRSLPKPGKQAIVREQLLDRKLHTVCTEAKCPNRAECFGRGTATFLIMGDMCSRGCAFCAVRHGAPVALDAGEPQRICSAARDLGLSHVVITSVTRDDLADGGAGHFADAVSELKGSLAGVTVEVLVPDFGGNKSALELVLGSGPDVLNHNVETVPRLYPVVRPQADYRRSLSLLARAAQYDAPVVVKSGIMVGLGETEEEIVSVLADLRTSHCSIVTIGQYLQPSPAQVCVHEYIQPRQFDRYTAIGKELGFSAVFAGPFVRSSYHAGEVLERAGKSNPLLSKHLPLAG